MILPGHVYLYDGEPYKCVKVSVCRAVIHPVSTPSKLVSISPQSVLPEVRR